MRFGEYVAIVYTLINTLLIIVLYRHGIKCAITKVKHIVELKDRVLAPWGPLSISAIAELVIFRENELSMKNCSLRTNLSIDFYSFNFC